jgi:3-hydroxymyristoyl/3-hydroxydecanoyl-(acyl carrier protein) dehydratase
MKSDVSFTFEDIMEILPHRPPFLFVDRVVKLLPDKMIVTERDLQPDEPHFKGHFPGMPIMPGVLIIDALAQTSGLLWGLSKKVEKQASAAPEIFFLAASNMKFTHPSKPGETLRMTSSKDTSFGAFHVFNVEATSGRNLIAKGSLTLAMKDGHL